MVFEDRIDAGKKLALKLKKYKNKGTVVIALPRGGTPVGEQIARYLNAPLDLMVVRKIGSPNDPEYAIGAVASGGTWFMDKIVIQKLGITRSELNEISKREIREMIKRESKYRKLSTPLELTDKTVIMVDDGAATGDTMIAAIRSVKKHKPSQIVVAVPVCSDSAANDIKPLVSEFVCVYLPKGFTAVGDYYKNFTEVTDKMVAEILKQ